MSLLEDGLPSSLLEMAHSKAIHYLELYEEDYQRLTDERDKIMDDYHNMLNYLEYNKPAQLSEEEHGAMIHYLELENQITEKVKFAIYLCGHVDCTSYLQIMDRMRNFGSSTEETVL